MLAEVPQGSGTFAFVACGHPPPLLLRGEGDVTALEPSAPSPPADMAALIGGDCTVDTVDTVPPARGDRLLLHTDAVTETRDAAGAFFPPPRWARGQHGVPPRRLPDRLHRTLLRYGGGAGLDDGIAALVIRYEGEPAPGGSAGGTPAPAE